MDMKKSSRHSKITGDFGEAIVLYWLSKHGFECAKVDHTGIDLIARHPTTNERLGISVKSRSRYAGTEKTDVGVPAGNFKKAEKACEAFGLTPYFAFVVDAPETLRLYLVSKRHLLEILPICKGLCRWRMTPADIRRYATDPDVMSVELAKKPSRWFVDELLAQETEFEEEPAEAEQPSSVPGEIVDEVESSSASLGETADIQSILAQILNPAVREFFRQELTQGRHYTRGGKQLVYRDGKRQRWFVRAQRNHARVWQVGRFADDEQWWRNHVDEELEFRPVSDGQDMTFNLTTARQLTRFKKACEAWAASNDYH